MPADACGAETPPAAAVLSAGAEFSSSRFRVLLDDLAHFSIMTEMNDNGSLSDVFGWRQAVRLMPILLAKTAHLLHAPADGFARAL
jgi:hypothetical protein